MFLVSMVDVSSSPGVGRAGGQTQEAAGRARRRDVQDNQRAEGSAGRQGGRGGAAKEKEEGQGVENKIHYNVRPTVRI